MGNDLKSEFVCPFCPYHGCFRTSPRKSYEAQKQELKTHVRSFHPKFARVAA